MKGEAMDGERIFKAASKAAVDAVAEAIGRGVSDDQAIEDGRRAFKETAFKLAGPQTRESRERLSTREV